jgi:small nuclear ribonucleoprotein (snRNP)-like protein
MEVSTIRKYAGKKVYLILKNNFHYTAQLPREIDKDFFIVDKFGNEVVISSDMVAFVQEVK